MLVPPASFGIAEEGIYRCSKVETLNLSFLETLNLKTVLFIGGQEPSKFFKEFFSTMSIEWNLIRVADFSSLGELVTSSVSKTSPREGVDGNSCTEYNNSDGDSSFGATYHLTDGDELMLIKSSCLKKTLKLLLNTEKYNILLVDRTSIIVGILRKIQKWSISSVINEYRLFAGKNRNYYAETFLEVIDLIIEQEKDDKFLMQGMEELNMGPDPLLLSAEMHRRASSTVVVNEEDLSRSPPVPQRLIKMVDEAESHSKVEHETFESPKISKSSSTLGIFGNRYRLAFNKSASGDYKYYKSHSGITAEDTLTIKIPRESLLPHWWKFQRDLWEKENAPPEHNFYKEDIFT